MICIDTAIKIEFEWVVCIVVLRYKECVKILDIATLEKIVDLVCLLFFITRVFENIESIYLCFTFTDFEFVIVDQSTFS